MAAPAILIATTNPAKAERLRRCLSGWPLRAYGPESLPAAVPPEETGGSHRAVAEEKARAWSRAAESLAIASDGGLIIPALGEAWDSLATRRAAGAGAADEDRLRHLLRLMEPHEGEARRALWQEAVALADTGGLLATWEVAGPIGYISRAPSPTRIQGFWAACLWHFPEVGKAYTELSAEELRQVGDPWSRLADAIQGWLRDGGFQLLLAGSPGKS